MKTGLRIYKARSPLIRYVQVYGERNSGTSFLTKVIRDNMRDPRNFLGAREGHETPLGTKLFGYKHWFIDYEKFKDPRSKETLFVVIYRNPYTWIRAMMARPYALSRSISGHEIEELPGLKLFGHVNGKDTTNEFHPKTGQPVDLFELRRLKIDNFEALKNYAENVVFVNLETLLNDLSGTMRALSESFESGFFSNLNLERKPPRSLVREYSRPGKFSPQETRVLNQNIYWPAEASIGYEEDSYFFGGA